MESLDIALKGIKAVLIYNMLREGVPKSNGIWEKRIQVVVTSRVRDTRHKIQEALFYVGFHDNDTISSSELFSDKQV